MRSHAFWTTLLLAAAVYAKPNGADRSTGTFQSNENPYEVVLLDGHTPTKFHDTICGITLKELAVLEPINSERTEFALKRILIEVESGKPASGPCAEAIMELYEKEDSLRPPIVLKKRGDPSSFDSNRPLSPPEESQPISKKKCPWRRRPIEKIADHNPFALRRHCRPRRERKPCHSSPWKSEQPCAPTQLPQTLREVRVPPTQTILYPQLPPLPRRCPNRRRQTNIPLPTRPGCRRDPNSYPCNHPNNPRPCMELLTPHSYKNKQLAQHRASPTLVHYRNEPLPSLPRRELTPIPVVPFKRREDIEPLYTNLNEEDRLAEENERKENNRPRILPVIANLPKSEKEEKIEEFEDEKNELKEEIREEEREKETFQSIDDDFVLPSEKPIDTEERVEDVNVSEETSIDVKPDYSAMKREMEETRRRRWSYFLPAAAQSV